jgi:hypothetical protein
MTMSWRGLFAYAFPPLALLQKVLLKVKRDQTELILVCPNGPNRAWFAHFTQCSGRPSSSHSSDPSVAHAATRDSVAFQPGRLLPGGMENKRQYVVAQGLFPEVAYTIIAARAPGTYQAYETAC